jgi:hypothetical protein
MRGAWKDGRVRHSTQGVIAPRRASNLAAAASIHVRARAVTDGAHTLDGIPQYFVSRTHDEVPLTHPRDDGIPLTLVG